MKISYLFQVFHLFFSHFQSLLSYTRLEYLTLKWFIFEKNSNESLLHLKNIFNIKIMVAFGNGSMNKVLATKYEEGPSASTQYLCKARDVHLSLVRWEDRHRRWIQANPWNLTVQLAIAQRWNYKVSPAPKRVKGEDQHQRLSLDTPNMLYKHARTHTHTPLIMSQSEHMNPYKIEMSKFSLCSSTKGT